MQINFTSKMIASAGIIDGYVMIAEVRAATVKDSLSVKNGGSRRTQRSAEAKQAAADEIAELQQIAEQFFDQIAEAASQNESLRKAAEVNSLARAHPKSLGRFFPIKTAFVRLPLDHKIDITAAKAAEKCSAHALIR